MKGRRRHPRALWKGLAASACAAVCAACRPPPARDVPGKTGSASASATAAIVRRAMDAMDAHWNPAENIFGGDEYPIRENAYYAAGLLARGQPGDAERARSVLRRVLAEQFRAPDRAWHGTFRRFPGEEPPAAALPWRHYDPNWREYVGTTLIVVLERFRERLPAELAAAIEQGLACAAEGAHARRVPGHYTNIAIMDALLLDWTGARFGRAEWTAHARRLADDILAGFRENLTFPEYNSPTYYGVDLYGLSLWRQFGSSPHLRAAGALMERELWREIAAFYHAGLQNLCGPFDRMYGMDLRRYVALAGAWIAMTGAASPAPMPETPMAGIPRRTGTELDLLSVPLYAIVGTRVPDDVLPHLASFRGPRAVRRVITWDPTRKATAWLENNVMLGAEFTSGRGDLIQQMAAATVHWRTPDGDVGWIALAPERPADAVVEGRELRITCHLPGNESAAAVFRASAPGLAPAAIGRDEWSLPGLRVAVQGLPADPVLRPGENREFEIRCPAPGRCRLDLRLRVTPTDEGTSRRE